GRVRASERVRRITASAVLRQPQRPIGERLARASRARRVLRILTVESPLPHVILAVSSEPLIVAEPGPRPHYVPALDPGNVVHEFERVPILSLGTLVERGAGQARVSRPREIREGPDIERSLRFGHALDAGVFIEVSSQQIGRELDQAIKSVKAELVEQGRTQIAGDAGSVILAPRTGVRDAESGRASRLAEAVVIQAIAEEYLVAVADAVIDARGELVFIEHRGGRKDKNATGCAGGRQVWVEEGGLRGQSRRRNPIIRKGHANRATTRRVGRRRQRVVDSVCHGAKIP